MLLCYFIFEENVLKLKSVCPYLS